MMTMMEVIEARRSIRKFENKPVEPEKLQAILEAMRLAPSAVNRQKWHFYAVVDAAKRGDIARVTGNAWLAEAPVLLAVSCDDCGVMTNGHRSDTVDCSIAMSFGMLEAAELGIGTCWLASYREADLRPILGLSDGESITALVAAGYPAEHPAPRPRKRLDEVATIM